MFVVKTTLPSSLHLTSLGSSVLSVLSSSSVWFDSQLKSPLGFAALPAGIFPPFQITFNSAADTKVEINKEIK